MLWRAAGAALLAVCFAVTLTFLALPLVALFTQVPLRDVPSLLGDKAVQDALAVTVRTNAIANALILGFGTPTAWILATRRFRGRALAVTLVELPLVAAAGGGGHRAARRVRGGGLAGAALKDAGIVLPFSQWAVVLAITFVASPFYIRQAIAAFEGVDPTLLDTARTLGAGAGADVRARSRCRSPPAGSAAGWVLAFARGVGEFGATIIFAGNVHGQDADADARGLRGARIELRRRARASGCCSCFSARWCCISYKLLIAWRGSSSTSQSAFARSPSTSR